MVMRIFSGHCPLVWGEWRHEVATPLSCLYFLLASLSNTAGQNRAVPAVLVPISAQISNIGNKPRIFMWCQSGVTWVWRQSGVIFARCQCGVTMPTGGFGCLRSSSALRSIIRKTKISFCCLLRQKSFLRNCRQKQFLQNCQNRSDRLRCEN